MTTMTMKIATSGNADADDKLAMNATVAAENVKRAALPTPLPPLPTGTAAELKTSYEACGVLSATLWHQANVTRVKAATTAKAPVRELKQLIPTLTDAKIAALLTLAKAP
jgi:hypothetical protein